MTHQALTSEAENPTLKKKEKKKKLKTLCIHLLVDVFSLRTNVLFLWLRAELPFPHRLATSYFFGSSRSSLVFLVFLPSSSTAGANESWTLSAWGPNPAPSPAGRSRGAPNASLEYWMNPGTTSTLPDRRRYRCLAIALRVVPGLRRDGWALNPLCCGAQEEIQGTGGLLKFL